MKSSVKKRGAGGKVGVTEGTAEVGVDDERTGSVAVGCARVGVGSAVGVAQPAAMIANTMRSKQIGLKVMA